MISYYLRWWWGERANLVVGSAMGNKIEQYFLSVGSICMISDSEGKAWPIGWHNTWATIGNWTLKELKAFQTLLPKLKVLHRDPHIVYQTPTCCILALGSDHAPFQESHRNTLQLIIMLRFWIGWKIFLLSESCLVHSVWIPLSSSFSDGVW